VAKLDELRAQFRAGASVPEPRRTLRNPSWSPVSYKISVDGEDVLLKFGRHRGKTLRQILKRDPNYLDFILRETFPTELKDVVRRIVQEKAFHGRLVKATPPDLEAAAKSMRDSDIWAKLSERTKK